MKHAGGEAQVDPLFYNSIAQPDHNLLGWSSLLFSINATNAGRHHVHNSHCWKFRKCYKLQKKKKTQNDTKQTNNPKMENENNHIAHIASHWNT